MVEWPLGQVKASTYITKYTREMVGDMVSVVDLTSVLDPIIYVFTSREAPWHGHVLV